MSVFPILRFTEQYVDWQEFSFKELLVQLTVEIADHFDVAPSHIDVLGIKEYKDTYVEWDEKTAVDICELQVLYSKDLAETETIKITWAYPYAEWWID